LSWTLIDYQNKVGKLESFFIHAKEYYNNNKPSDAATFENASINADYLIESWIAKEAKEYKKSKEEYSSKLRLNTATALFFVSILLASVYMELQIIANAKKLKLDYKEEYQLLKEELRKDPTNTALREKVLKIARLGGYDEQIIANDLSVIK